MDYIVAGFGIGAILALIGFALWELYGNREEPGHGWLSRAAIGAMLGALVIWAVTGVTLVSTLDDSTASRLVMLTTIITVVAILVGTFWYWRADQAVLASMPQRTAQQPQEQFAAVAAAPRETNIELSEWDSWPEREEKPDDTFEPPNAPATETDFAPEVAAEPTDVAEGRPEPRAAVAEQDSVDEEAAPVEDIVLDVAVEAPPPSDELEPEVPAFAGAAEPVAVVPAPETLPPTEAPVAAAEAATVLMALPANVRPLRSKQAPASNVPAPNESTAAADLSVSTSDSAPGERAASTSSDQPSKTSAGQNGAKAPIEPPAPAAFESSLLADIDGTGVEGNGRYQSPLLADLESNPDELEGVGLAKWPADARLTADDLEAPRTPKGRRKR